MLHLARRSYLISPSSLFGNDSQRPGIKDLDTHSTQTLNSLGSTLLGTYRRAHITRALEKEHWGNICVE